MFMFATLIISVVRSNVLSAIYYRHERHFNRPSNKKKTFYIHFENSENIVRTFPIEFPAF